MNLYFKSIYLDTRQGSRQHVPRPSAVDLFATLSSLIWYAVLHIPCNARLAQFHVTEDAETEAAPGYLAIDTSSRQKKTQSVSHPSIL
jgi:hypothetical protein